MISADIKANKVKEQEIKDLVGCLTNFYKKYPQNLKYNGKRACIFHLILVGILIHLDIVSSLRTGVVGVVA